jgi:hypothetical protein
MPVLKHAIPKSGRTAAVDFVNNNFPDGFVREHIADSETILGLALVAYGAKLDKTNRKAGLALRVVGQVLDDIDGDTARALGISSEFGAKLDQVADKLKMLMEIKTLWGHTNEFSDQEQVKRRRALGFIAAKHTINAGLNVASFFAHLEPHSSMAGKVNLWVDGIAVTAFGLSDAIDTPEISQKVADLGYLATGIGIPTGIVTAGGYARDLITGLYLKSE